MEKDKTVQSLLRGLEKLQTDPLPERGEIAAAMLKARQAILAVRELRGRRPRRLLAIKTQRARLRERLAIIAQRNDLVTVADIRRKLGIDPSAAPVHDGPTPNSSAS